MGKLLNILKTNVLQLQKISLKLKKMICAKIIIV